MPEPVTIMPFTEDVRKLHQEIHNAIQTMQGSRHFNELPACLEHARLHLDRLSCRHQLVAGIDEKAMAGQDQTVNRQLGVLVSAVQDSLMECQATLRGSVHFNQMPICLHSIEQLVQRFLTQVQSEEMAQHFEDPHAVEIPSFANGSANGDSNGDSNGDESNGDDSTMNSKRVRR